MEREFDFTMTESEYVYNISSTIKLCIKRINHSVAILYFTDKMNKKINIPDDIVVYTYDYEDVNKKIIQKAINNDYPLCWTDNYTIEYKQIQIISLNNQRKWNIVS
jgi:hypothetical protein